MIDEPHRTIPFDNIRGLLQDFTLQLDHLIMAQRNGTRYENARRSDLKVFIMASRQPHTLSSLARALSISRQAVHSSVKRLAALQVVEVLPLAGSARDKIVTVTEKGWHARQTANEQIVRLEAECASIIGEKGLEQFRMLLQAMVLGLKSKHAFDTEIADADAAQAVQATGV